MPRLIDLDEPTLARSRDRFVGRERERREFRNLDPRPDDALTFHYRGIARGILGDDRGALADFDLSLDLRSDTANTFYNRALTKRKLGDHTGALADYNRSLELQPDAPHTMYNLACLFALQADADTALDWLAKAIALDKSNHDAACADPDFDAIRADPRFVALVGDAGAE
jgi:tetratricopeptide (TPR) repeat protein